MFATCAILAQFVIKRHVLMECSALLDLRVAFAPLIAEASGIMARLVWADDQPLVSNC